MANEANLTPFKEGESGNLNGRPKGARNRSTIVREMLQHAMKMQDVSDKNIAALEKLGIKDRVEVEQILTAAQIIKASEGDTKAYQALMDSTYGQPKQQTEIELKSFETIVPGDEDTP